MATTSELVAKSGTKSIVWDYFGLERGTDGKVVDDGIATCRSCRKKVKAKQGNTSNLLAHLRTTHGLLHAEVKAAMKGGSSVSRSVSRSRCQPTLIESVSNSQKYERKGKKWNEITDAVTHCIAKDLLPIYSVEKSGFKHLLNTLDARYEIPSRSYFSRTAIPNLYASTRNQVKQEIGEVQYYSATTDMWSSIGMKPYMSYTVHFIDHEWELKTRCLQTQFMPENHTGENIAEAMEATLDAWELTKSVQVCLTTDNGANIVNACERLKWPRLSCFGHNLHLAITNSLKDDRRCTRALGVARKIVSSFSMSWKRRRDLSKAQVNLELQQCSLVSDCATRWGSMAKMVSRILQQEEAIRVVLSTDRKVCHLVPTWQDIDVLQSIDRALSSLSTLTDMLSGESYVTASAVLPMVKLIDEKLLKEKEEDTRLTKDIKNRIKQDLTSRYEDLGEIADILNISTFLDPRFKTKHIKDEDLARVKDLLLADASDCQGTQQRTTERQESSSNPPPPKKRNLGSMFKEQEETEDEMPVLSPEQQFSAELTLYENASMLDLEEDPLQWWKLSSHNYPTLSKLAKKYLAVCATSACSERLFSTSGKIVTPLRSCLKPSKVDMLVFLSRNLPV